MTKITYAMGPRTRGAGYPEAVQQLKLQTQKLLGLSDGVTISLTELTCREPGCPDVETVIGILREGEKPAIARIHKPIPEVTLDELRAALELASISKTVER